MYLEKGFLYHIYNQGNNRRQIFFNDSNYLFFLKKIKTYITPYSHIIAWCLMPNHFHLMIFVQETELAITNIQGMTLSHPLNKDSSHISKEMTQGQPLTSSIHHKVRTINDSIAIMLRSYTRAINKQENFSGALFRKATKAECINCPKGFTPSFITKNGISQFNTNNIEQQYPQICFNYLHQNPVKAGLVKYETEWNYSSAKDYSGLRNGKLVNISMAKELGISIPFRE